MPVTDFIKKYFEPEGKVRTRDILRELPSSVPEASKKVGGKILTGFQKSGQTAFRGYAGMGSALTGRTLTPSTYFQKQLYGTDKPITARSFGAELGLKEKGVFAAPIGFALAAADLIPGGKVTKNGAVTLLKNVNKIDDAFRVLKQVMGIADDVAKKYANDAARITDAGQLRKLVDDVVEESQQVSRFIKKGKTFVNLISGKPTKVDKKGFGLAKIESDHPDVIPFLEESFQKAKIVEKLPERTILEANTKGGRIRLIVDHQLGKKKLNFLNNAYFVLKEGIEPPTPSASNLRSTIELLKRKKVIDIPALSLTKNSVSVKERGFITSAKEVIPEADRIAGQYIPRSTDTLSIKAKNLIASDFATAEKIALSESDDRAVAIASELLKKYANDAARATDPAQISAIYDKAANVANTLAPKLTEQGRSIQAASILGRLTPEGQVRFAAREIQRWNELNPTRKIAELTGEQAKYITEEMRVIRDMAEGTEKAMRFQKLQNYIQDLVPTPLIKKIIAVWKAGLLTGIKTQGLNIFSNLFHGTSEMIKDVPASIVDSAVSLFTGKRTKTATIRGAFKGIEEGLIKGKRYFSTGFDERNIAAKLDYKRVNFGKGAVAKAFQTYTDTVFRFLGAQDQPFYYAALSRSLMDQALAQGKNLGLKGTKLVKYAHNLVESPTEEMIRYGVADATTAVFQNKTALGEAAKKVQQIPGVGEFVLPFGRTPSAVAMQIINYSPVGIAKTIIENIGKGRFDQRLFSQGLGRGLTGTAILAIGVELAKKGLISLDYPLGDEREQELQKAEGVKPNSIKVDDKWRSPISLGPAGNLLLIGGHFQNAVETSGSPTEAMTKAMLGGLKSFTEQTFLTGISQSINAITDPERYAKSYLPNLAASFVPTIVSDISRATDPLERRAESPLERIQKRVPGARTELEPQIDILGRERKRVGNPLEVMADPTRPSPEKGTIVTDELRRLTEAGFRVSPTALGNRQGYDVLTQEENTKLWKHAGEIVNNKLESLFSKTSYHAFEDDEKVSHIESIVRQAKINARAAMAIKLTEGLSGEELKNKLSELKDGGLLTRDVFNKYKELR